MTPHNIHTIARYEVKLLKRSWLFRIFALLAVGGIFGALLVYQTSIINRYDTIWPRIAVSSIMPFTSIYFYNIAQSIIVVFLAGSFLKRDKKLDTAEVIYVRPMSNADYIIGKTWGIVKVFLILNIYILLFTAFLNLLVTKSPFQIFPYIFYLLTISFPSLLFVLGLSFTMMCLLKNQAVTFIVMLGFIGTEFFYLSDNCYGVFDFFGVHIPAIFSDVTGHADLRLFLLQRFIYLLAGLGLITFTIALVKRLPHKPWKIIIIHTLGVIFMLGAGLAGTLYILHYNHQLGQRQDYALTFNQYNNFKNAEILTHDLRITPQGKQLEASSNITLINPHPDSLDKILFYLNPSLQVYAISAGQKELPFTQEKQTVLVDLPLKAQEETTLTIHYRGRIDETVCYTDVLEKDYLDNKFPQAFYRFGKRYAWLEDKFTLLTPECIWYPVTTPPVNPAAPYNVKKNFVNYTLTVDMPAGKTVLSQGDSRQEEEQIIFTNPTPLPGISLTIADYEKKSIRVDSVDYEIFYFKGHDYFSPYFTLLNDTLPAVLRDMKNDREIAVGRNYPFSKFVLAETPVQFASYARNWKGNTEYIMPGIAFIPERGATLNSDFHAQQIRNQEWRRRDDAAPDETEMAINNLRQFFQSVFTAENTQYGWDWNTQYINKFNINPMFFGYTGFIASEEYPIIDIALNTMQTSSNTRYRFWGGIINDRQRANLYLESHSFRTAIADLELKPEIFFELLKLKSQALKNYISTLLPPEELNEFLKDFFEEYKFRDIPFNTFKTEFEEYSGIDLSGFIHRWYTEDHSPTIFIKDVDANQVVIDEVTKYQVKFKVHNSSDVDAIITAQIQQGGNWGGGHGGGRFNSSSSSEEAENYVIPAQAAREIKIITDERPANVTINTNISHNLPTNYMFNFSKVDNITTDTLAGTFPVSPDIFRPNPKEIIIDNEDSGFRTIASNNRHKLKDLFQKKEEEKYKNFMPWRNPSKWTAIAADYCYGASINSAVYKKQGSGNNSVEWRAELPKDSYYEVSIWNPKMDNAFVLGGRGRRRERNERNQTYTLAYDQGKESITLDLTQEDGGWVTLGNFYLPQGTATITLTDKVSGNYVIADAVKFTLLDE